MKDKKLVFAYALGFIFLLGLSIYLYLLIIDHKEGENHSIETQIWMYLFLIILIIGFIASFYFIICWEKEPDKRNFGNIYKKSKQLKHFRPIRV